nr:carbamoyltransferase HypF [uncultured Holophaga sp.]
MRLKAEVRGVVQGVGFRPFVVRLAAELALDGWVRNTPAGVELEVQGEPGPLRTFLGDLVARKPGPAQILELEHREIPEEEAQGFRILPSLSTQAPRPSVPADLSICPACVREMDSPGERRYRYPFTNCTDCGPRYTLIRSLPYDRPRTTMAGFAMCPHCEAQYRDSSDRRFHAQPIACPVCGPRLELLGRDGGRLALGEAALEGARTALAGGRILALKGLGGYQLLVDAGSEAAVERLRERKRREAKPFAVMFPDGGSLSRHCRATALELELLASSAAPILLLPKAGVPLAEAVAPGNPSLGAFLPFTPLHRLLVDRPLVCTSGNLSEEPMAFGDAEALERLREVADLFLGHDRPIQRPVDDSVGRVEAGTLHLLRRARGYAPLPHPVVHAGLPVLAFGAHQKSTVTLLFEGQAVVSQHLGDLEGPQNVDLLGRTVEDLLAFFRVEPGILACDLHPDYASTRLAEAMARERGLPLHRIQHHHAHAGACAAEHGLEGDFLALAWDGSGFGSDGTVWGGEALTVSGAAFRRVGHLGSFPLPGGERAVREPRRSALGLCWSLLGGAGPAAGLFPAGDLAALERVLERKLNTPSTSSMGRLFDAMAALTGIRAEAGFEGQAAMMLEFAARGVGACGAYPIGLSGGRAELGPLVEGLQADLGRGTSPAVMARRFHAALADLALAWSQQAGLERVALTGGCFQNALLAELCSARLAGAGFRVLRPARFPANDGGISLGQAWVAAQWGKEV